MPDTFSKIATVTVGAGGASSINFASIPSIYTDLCLKLSLRGSGAGTGDHIYATFNGSTSGYSGKWLEGNGSAASSNGGTSLTKAYFMSTSYSSATANVFGSADVYISNYASSNNKSFSVDTVGETNGTTQYMDIVAGLWANSAAINQITITPASSTWAQYSEATLYGIVKA